MPIYPYRSGYDRNFSNGGGSGTPGPQGEQGERGPEGPQGPQGEPGTGSGGLKWYTEDTESTYPIIDVDPNFSQIGLGNEYGGYVQVFFRTGGNNAGYILADDGTFILQKTEGTCFEMTDKNYNLLIDNVSVLNSDGFYTNLIAMGSAVTLAPGFAGMTSPAGSLELDDKRGIKLYGNGGVNSIIDASELQATFADNNTANTKMQGQVITLDANSKGTMEMDGTAVRFKRGNNQLMSMSDSGGAMTWNSVIRCVWNADGWNVSHDTGVAFSSRATYSMMQAKSGARVQTDATGTTIVSSDNSTLASKISVTNGSVSFSGGPLLPTTQETLGTATKPWTNIYLDSSTPLVVQTNTSYGTVSAEDIAKMANVVPKALNTADGSLTIGYMYEDIIAAFGEGSAKIYGLAFLVDGVEVVNPVACLMMEALYVRSRLQ